MTLDEAIKHAEEVAEKNERRAESVRNRPISSADFYHEEESCSKCADDHRQLAKWLKELKAYREQGGVAIRSFEAWKNVQKEIYSQIDALDEIHEFRDKKAYFKALDIINKYLKEVEE